MGEEGPGAGFFPLWYGGAMIVLSLVLVAASVARPSAREPVRWKDVGRALTCWAAFVAVDRAHAVGGIRRVVRAPRVVHREGDGRAVAGEGAIVLALAFAAGFYALFELGLDLALPKGVLF
jgi:putative tricarboxylic transport membrane protein